MGCDAVVHRNLKKIRQEEREKDILPVVLHTVLTDCVDAVRAQSLQRQHATSSTSFDGTVMPVMHQTVVAFA